MRVRITAGQALHLHGLWAPKLTLSWHDVVDNPALTLAHLHRSARVPVDDLFKLQPDAAAWIRAGRATLADCPLMEPWCAHPVRDFRADLGDVIAQRWSADAMARMGLAYADLVELGLTPDSMALFTTLTLVGWAQIGLSRAAAAAIPEGALARLFGMAKHDVLRSLR